MKKSIPIILSIIIGLAACGEKKKSLAGNEKVVSSDFFKAFSDLKLPFSIVDTAIKAVKADTTNISYDIFSQFVPDTVITNVFGNDKITALHSVGKREVKDKETYVIMQALSKKQAAIYLLIFDKNKKFRTSVPLVRSNQDANTHYSSTIDNRLAISVNKEWKTENEILYNKVIYAYNNDLGIMNVVMTETNDQSNVEGRFLNPLDTLPKNNKYSGDYSKGKKNIISIRDGKTAESYVFFLHFENEIDAEEEPCNGELRGGFTMRSANTAIFSENNDPCVVDFTFTKNEVKVKEQGSCGSHRGIKCFFNDTYTKKKEPKATKKTQTAS
jgi:hypothetical protein